MSYILRIYAMQTLNVCIVSSEYCPVYTFVPLCRPTTTELLVGHFVYSIGLNIGICMRQSTSSSS